MKTINHLHIHCNAISTVTSFLNVIRDTQTIGDEEKLQNDNAMTLNGDKYLGMSDAMTVVRELYAELPDALRSEDESLMINAFYIHLYKDEETKLFNIRKAKRDASELHTIIYKRYEAAREAIALYS